MLILKFLQRNRIKLVLGWPRYENSFEIFIDVGVKLVLG
jgi:hypothetical protein